MSSRSWKVDEIFPDENMKFSLENGKNLQFNKVSSIDSMAITPETYWICSTDTIFWILMREKMIFSLVNQNPGLFTADFSSLFDLHVAYSTIELSPGSDFTASNNKMLRVLDELVEIYDEPSMQSHSLTSDIIVERLRSTWFVEVLRHLEAIKILSWPSSEWDDLKQRGSQVDGSGTRHSIEELARDASRCQEIEVWKSNWKFKKMRNA